jgi:hypothetical protein
MIDHSVGISALGTQHGRPRALMWARMGRDLTSARSMPAEARGVGPHVVAVVVPTSLWC